MWFLTLIPKMNFFPETFFLRYYDANLFIYFTYSFGLYSWYQVKESNINTIILQRFEIIYFLHAGHRGRITT